MNNKLEYQYVPLTDDNFSNIKERYEVHQRSNILLDIVDFHQEYLLILFSKVVFDRFSAEYLFLDLVVLFEVGLNPKRKHSIQSWNQSHVYAL